MLSLVDIHCNNVWKLHTHVTHTHSVLREIPKQFFFGHCFRNILVLPSIFFFENKRIFFLSLQLIFSPAHLLWSIVIRVFSVGFELIDPWLNKQIVLSDDKKCVFLFSLKLWYKSVFSVLFSWLLFCFDSNQREKFNTHFEKSVAAKYQTIYDISVQNESLPYVQFFYQNRIMIYVYETTNMCVENYCLLLFWVVCFLRSSFVSEKITCEQLECRLKTNLPNVVHTVLWK